MLISLIARFIRPNIRCVWYQAVPSWYGGHLMFIQILRQNIVLIIINTKTVDEHVYNIHLRSCSTSRLRDILRSVHQCEIYASKTCRVESVREEFFYDDRTSAVRWSAYVAFRTVTMAQPVSWHIDCTQFNNGLMAISISVTEGEAT